AGNPAVNTRKCTRWRIPQLGRLRQQNRARGFLTVFRCCAAKRPRGPGQPWVTTSLQRTEDSASHLPQKPDSKGNLVVGRSLPIFPCRWPAIVAVVRRTLALPPLGPDQAWMTLTPTSIVGRSARLRPTQASLPSRHDRQSAWPPLQREWLS